MSTLYGPWVASDDGRNLYDEGEHDIRLDIDGDWSSQEQRIAFATALADAMNEVATLRAKVSALEADAARWQTARKLSLRAWSDAWRLNLSTGKPFDQIIDELAPFYAKDKP